MLINPIENDSCIHFSKDSIKWGVINMSQYFFDLDPNQFKSQKLIIDDLKIIKEMTDPLLDVYFENSKLIKIYIIENNTGRKSQFIFDKITSKFYAVSPIITNEIFVNYPVNISLCELKISQKYNLESMLEILNKSHFLHDKLDIHGAFKFRFIIDKSDNLKRRLLFISGDLLSHEDYLKIEYPNNYLEIFGFLNYLKELMDSN